MPKNVKVFKCTIPSKRKTQGLRVCGWCCDFCLQAYRDLKVYAYRMSSLVVDLLCDMERDPPPQHTLGAHLMRCKHQETGVLSFDGSSCVAASTWLSM